MSSPAQQFESINSSVLSFLCNPTLTYIHNYSHTYSSHTYITTGKTIALTIWTFVSKVMPVHFNHCLGFPDGSGVKDLPAMQETRLQSLGQEDPLEEGMATHYRILAWKIPMDRGAWQAAAYRVAQSRAWLKWLSSSSSRFLIAFLPRSKHLLIS